MCSVFLITPQQTKVHGSVAQLCRPATPASRSAQFGRPLPVLLRRGAQWYDVQIGASSMLFDEWQVNLNFCLGTRSAYTDERGAVNTDVTNQTAVCL